VSTQARRRHGRTNSIASARHGPSKLRSGRRQDCPASTPGRLG